MNYSHSKRRRLVTGFVGAFFMLLWLVAAICAFVILLSAAVWITGQVF